MWLKKIVFTRHITQPHLPSLHNKFLQRIILQFRDLRTMPFGEENFFVGVQQTMNLDTRIIPLG